MPIGITDEHHALHDAVRGWVERHCPPARAAGRCSSRAPRRCPPFWADLAAQGWLGLHLDEAYGGEGYGIPELVVVLEELGRAVAPGPFLATVARRRGAPGRGQGRRRRRSCRAWLAGDVVGAVALDGDARRPSRRATALACRGHAAPGPVAVTSPTLLVADAGGTVGACCRRRVRARRERDERRPHPARRRGHRRRRRRSRRRGSLDRGRRRPWSATSPRCCSRPRRSASRSGASTPRPSTRRTACSSAGRSASSRA